MNVCPELVKLPATPLSLTSEPALEESFMKLITIIEIFPEAKTLLKSLLAGTLATWGRLLERIGNYDKLFESYRKALCVFSDHEGILTNLGAHLLRAGYVENASVYFQEALKVNNSYLPAKRNLETIYNMYVERWHFRMLNDSIRNNSFREAIIKKVQQGFDCVLDIGTGTGILSLFAVEGGAQEIYACDSSKTMIGMSERVLVRNNAMGKVKLLNKLSNDIKIPSDIPNRVSLVITETVDVGLIGENILQTLIHAWDSLLLPCLEEAKMKTHIAGVKHEIGCVIPHSAAVWVAAVECSYIALKYRTLKHDAGQHSQAKSKSSKYHKCLECLTFNLFAYDGHAYDSLDMQNVPQGFRFLTQPTKTIEVNFNDRKNMEQLLDGTVGDEIVVSCTEEGRIDAIVMWFDLKLDEDIVLSSAPMDLVNRAKCWDQAIFALQIPVNVKRGQNIRLEVNCLEGKMTVKINSMEPSETTCPSAGFQSSSFPVRNTVDINHIINSMKQNYEKFEPRSFPVSPDIVSYLNDQNLISSLNDVFNVLVQTEFATNSINILDLSPFPLFGILFLIHEQSITGKCDSALYCVANEEQDKIAILLVASVHHINHSQLHLINDEMLEVFNPAHKFDLILTHPVESSGKVNEKYATYFPLLSQIRKPTGLILPKEMKLCCQVIQSKWLKEVSEVIGEERLCGYDIAPFINEYKVSEHLDFVFSATEHQSYTEIIETPAFSMDDFISSVSEPLIFKISTCVKSDGFVTAVPYWFKMKLLEECIEEVSTRLHSSFANQAAVLLDPQIYVKTGDILLITFICHEGLLHVTITKDSQNVHKNV